MSEEQNEASLAITPQQYQSLPQESQQSLIGQLERAGFSKDQLATLTGSSDAPPNPGATQLPGSDVRIGVPNDGLTPAQRLAGYRTALKFASDREAVLTSAERDGISRAELETEPQSPADALAAQRDADAMAAMSPPASPNDYKLQYPRDAAATVPPDELQAFDAAARSAFHAAGVPKTLATGLLNALLDTADSYDEGMSEAARQLRHQENGARLRKLSGDVNETARLATKAYNALPQSFRGVMEGIHAFHSAEAQLALAQVGRAIEYREARKK